ncbi:LysR substrate-binding domain-containing protein [Neptuniibacter pectenicola]|jgi:DNA-binding transcriptional LysR family regulator|uniref:LysR substrate-binding domain-containing protein n=1 Tax=Neptuniibacter pectenicola TaxID=1806669 RepID=A0ABU9TUE6_9GAMM|tara:strand:+ start:8426 stop:9376 length:951 start_codon:yes stop_codon:yes gene_type:complete
MQYTVPRIASRLTFRQLQVFHAVYSSLNYSKAGEKLGLTQPAVSGQIRQLEQVLGSPLFEYIGRRLYITGAGQALATHTESIFRELEKLQIDLSEQQGNVAGDLRLVAVSTAQYVVPYLIKDFSILHPNVHITVSVVNRATALQRMEENRDDLTIMGLVPENRPLKVLPFLNNELIPVVPAGHPLLTQKRITPQQFLDSQLLLREAGSGSRLALETHCFKNGLKLKGLMDLGSNAAIKHAVIAGLGVAVLPRLSLISELKLGKLHAVTVPGFPLNRSWCLVYPESKYPTPAMKAFADYMQHNLQQIEAQFKQLQNA